MNICISTSSFPLDRDDTSGFFVLELARALKNLGHQVTVVCPRVSNRSFATEMDGIRVVRFRYLPFSRAQTLIGIQPGISSLKSFRQLAKVPALLMCQAFTLFRVVRKQHIDVINSHWLLPQGVTAALVARICGVRHLPTLHSTDIFLAGKLYFGRTLCRFVDNSAYNTFVVSRFVRQRYEKILGHQARVEVLPMGVDTRRFVPPAPDGHLSHEGAGKNILFVGRLHPVKGVETLVSALRLLVDDDPDTRLTIAGDGQERERLQEQIDRLDLGRHVDLVGRVRNEDLPDFYRRAAVVAVPSLQLPSGETEGMPVVVLEAMACGTPVVASDVGGIGDIVRDNANGFLVPAGNPRELADAIQRAIAQRAVLSEAAGDTARQFSWDKIGAIYQQAMERGTE